MGRRAGSHQGPGKDSPSREVVISKAISWILRHGAEKEGLKLDKRGYANVAELLAWHKLKRIDVTLKELKQIVVENDKQRFSLIPVHVEEGDIFEGPASDSDDPATYLIRANQGHSIAIDSASLLTPITENNIPEVVVHGTFYGAWPLILEAGGLRKMSRNHIHFARGVPGGAAPVISGMRKDAQILIYVDTRKAMDAGLKWWKSENEVVLTEGDEHGILGLDFFIKVVERIEGLGVLWENGQIVKDLPQKLAARGLPKGKEWSARGGKGGKKR